ncbi:MAG: type I-E CRISPR-associated protein Cas6/Cse3/CasE [Thermoguttaceae bacterium]
MTPLFLTQAFILYDTALRHKIGNSYDWHQEIWRCFSVNSNREREFLTRVDRQNQRYCVWILSCTEPRKPDWVENWQTKPVASTFLEHSRYYFTLRANPTKKTVNRDPLTNARAKQGKRISLFREDELRNWITRKAELHGFELDTSNLSCSPPVREYFYKKTTNQHGFHLSVDFSGTLTVSDRCKFIETYQNGIGSAKGFGFGMLLLKPDAPEV